MHIKLLWPYCFNLHTTKNFTQSTVGPDLVILLKQIQFYMISCAELTMAPSDHTLII